MLKRNDTRRVTSGESKEIAERRERVRPRVVTAEDMRKPPAEPSVFLAAAKRRHRESVAAVRRHRAELLED